MGSGSGYVICSLALLLQQLGVAAQLLATDINSRAAAATAETLEAHEVVVWAGASHTPDTVFLINSWSRTRERAPRSSRAAAFQRSSEEKEGGGEHRPRGLIP